MVSGFTNGKTSGRCGRSESGGIYKCIPGYRKFRGDSKLSTWIGSVAFHVTADFLRRKGREVIQFTGEPSKLEIRLPENLSPLEVVSKNDLKSMVHRMIEALPLQYRTVITLYHLEQFSYNEISEITGMPEGTVKSYISRGRTAIRETLLKKVPDMQHDILSND